MEKILILGAGYTGMMAATGLEKKNQPFAIINKQPYHYFTTLLHEAAGGRGEPMDYTVQISDVLRKPTSKVILDEVTKIDREKRVVHGANQTYEYEYLIIGLGWVSEYFGIPGLKENSLTLVNVDSAITIRSHIESQLKTYQEDKDPMHLRIVVGGGGLTGIELVGELLEWLPQLCVKYGIAFEQLDLQNIEAMPSILPQLAEPLRAVAMQTLAQKGAKLRTNTKIASVEHQAVHLADGEVVQAGTIIWTGGVRANPIMEQAGFTVDRRGRAKVTPNLQSVDDPFVFIGGDSAWCEVVEGKPLPPTAQMATQMGRLLADNVSSFISGGPMKPFVPSDKGVLASLGAEVGVGAMGTINVKGVVAGLAKEATKVKYLWELGGLRLAAQKTGQIVHY